MDIYLFIIVAWTVVIPKKNCQKLLDSEVTLVPACNHTVDDGWYYDVTLWGCIHVTIDCVADSW